METLGVGIEKAKGVETINISKGGYAPANRAIIITRAPSLLKQRHLISFLIKLAPYHQPPPLPPPPLKIR